MPTAHLSTGLGLLNLPFDGAVAGSPVAAAGAAGDEQPGVLDGFPAMLAEQINNTKNVLQHTDKNEYERADYAILALQLGPVAVYPMAPGLQDPAVPVELSERGVPGITLAQVEPGLPTVAGEGSGSVLPGERQNGAASLPTADADWLGSQLAALGRERLADPVVTSPRGHVPAPGPVPPGGQSGSADSAAGTAAPITGPAPPVGFDELIAQTGQPAGAGPMPGHSAAAPPTLVDAKPQLPALPEQAARALPAAAYLRQDLPVPPPDPRVGGATAAPGATAEQTTPPTPTTRGALAHAPPSEPATALPAAAAVRSSVSAEASTSPGHAGNSEVPGSSLQLQAAPAATAPVVRAAPPPVAPIGELATSSTEPAREAAPAASWLAARMGALPQLASQSSPRAEPHGGMAPKPAMPDAAQLGPGAGAATSPLLVSGDARAAAGATLASVDSSLDRETAPGAGAPDSAPRGTGLPAAGPSMAAPAPPRTESTVASVLGQPLQLASAGFADELGQRILWLSGSNLRSAEIYIDPPELGPLQITVQAHREGTTVHFTTHNTQARDAVEATLPRLRELLEANGAGTVDVNVAQQQPDARPGAREAAAMASAAPRVARAEAATMDPVPRLRQGLIDDYA